MFVQLQMDRIRLYSLRSTLSRCPTLGSISIPISSETVNERVRRAKLKLMILFYTLRATPRKISKTWDKYGAERWRHQTSPSTHVRNRNTTCRTRSRDSRELKSRLVGSIFSLKRMSRAFRTPRHLDRQSRR